LPFAAVRNQRSIIALENLVDFIVLCVVHPAAVNNIFLISDGVDISTPDMVRYLREGMKKKARLFSVSNNLMRWCASLLGMQAIYSQLCSSFVVDSSKARNLLGWTPPMGPQEALIKAGRDFKLSRTIDK